MCPVAAQPAPRRTGKVEPILAPLLPAEPAWQRALPAAPAAGGTLDGDRLYVPLQNEEIVALDRESGKTLWTQGIESAWPVAAGTGVVFVAASDEVHALDAATGDRRWRVSVERGITAPMAAQGGLLLAMVRPDEVWAFSAEDGDRVWRRELGGISGPGSLTADATGVYVAFSGRVLRLALADGAVQWDTPVTGTLTTPALARERVLVGSTENRIYALDTEDGDIVWQWGVGGDVVGASADGDLVYFAALDNLLRAVNRSNGNQRWKKEITRPVAPPQSFGGIVVVAGNSPTASTFDAKTGAAIATYIGPGELQGGLLIDRMLRPFRVSLVAITREGQAVGLRPVQMMFRDPPATPMTELPGRALQREPRPAGR